MTSVILDILQQRVRMLTRKITSTQAAILAIQDDILATNTRLHQAQQQGDIAEIRSCLLLLQELNPRISALEKSLRNFQQSHRLFARQLPPDADTAPSVTPTQQR